ncbi:MAG: hypothetical protein WHV28_06490 [Bacteroidota bacterium]
MLINPKTINCQISVPFSKSEFLRACLIALLNKKFTIENIPNSEDATAAINILQNYSNCLFKDNQIFVEKINKTNDFSFHCGESAFLARSLTAISAIMGWNAKIYASGSLITRNLIDIFDFLLRNNIIFEGNSPFLPVTLFKSNIHNTIELDASQSSQLLSGLLIGNAFSENNFVIRCSNIVSKGYVALTLNMLEKIGVNYDYCENEYYLSNNSIFTSDKITITGDWSAAAFLMVAGFISGKVEILNLDQSSSQPDKFFLDFIHQLGLNCSIVNHPYKITCEKSIIPPFEFDATDYPDLIPPLVVLALNSKGKSVIKGVHRLLNKESNRALALLEEFTKIGANISIYDDIFIIQGNSQLSGGEVSSRNDHRIAMALAVAALNSKSGIVLDNPASVNKSFPDFWNFFI